MPFSEYESFDACVKANSDKDNPEAYCASVEHEITGKWPAEEAVRKRMSTAFKKQLREGFQWIGEVELFGTNEKNLVKVVALHPITTYHPNQWPEVRHYVEPELKKVAETFKGGYVSLDHYWIYDEPFGILESKWDEDDCRIEQLCYVPEEIVEKIRNGVITKVSVDMDWEILRKMNGVVPEGLKGLGVSFLEKLLPGDPQTSVKLLNAWGELIIKQARVWKGKSKLMESSTSPKKTGKRGRKDMTKIHLQDEPKTDVERAKNHNKLTDEEWNAKSEEEKQELIDALPEPGTKRLEEQNHGCAEDEEWNAEEEKCVKKKVAEAKISLSAQQLEDLAAGKIKLQDVLPTPTTPPTTPPGEPPAEHITCPKGTVWVVDPIDPSGGKCVPAAGAVEPTTSTPTPSPSTGVTMEAMMKLKLEEMRSPEEIKKELGEVAGKRDALYGEVDALWPVESALQAELEAVIQAEIAAAVKEPAKVTEAYKWIIEKSMSTILGEQEDEGPFQCPYCDHEPFDTKELLETHIADKHADKIEEFWKASYRQPIIAKFVQSETKKRLDEFFKNRLTPAQKLSRELAENRRAIANLIQQAQENEQRWMRSPEYREVNQKMGIELVQVGQSLKAKDIQLGAVTAKLKDYAEIIKNADAISRQAVMELMAPTLPRRMGGRTIKTTVKKGSVMSVPGLPAHTIIRQRLEQIRRQVKKLPNILN